MTLYVPAPNKSVIATALRGFLLSILPDGDAIFVGTISGATLTVASISQGSINLLDPILGVDVAPGTIVESFGTGTGGIGTYTLSQSQTIANPTTMTTGVEIVAGQDNRVPEPAGDDFIVFTEMFQRRLSTNVDTYADCAFTASIAGETMTVSAVQFGEIAVGNIVFGVGIADNTIITALGSGSGGVGSYSVSPGQTLGARVLAAGVELLKQPQEITFQIDVHGPNGADNAATISTFFRDARATSYFYENGFTGISPLYADDPRQIPFKNAEQQYEDRWIVEAHLQADQVLTAAQQFFAAVSVGLVNVQTYPVN